MPEPKPKTLKFDHDVLEEIRNAVWSEDGLNCRITNKLERSLYDRVNKALFAMGGVWKGGKVKAHVFEEDPRPQVEDLLASGVIEVERDGFFETPAPVVDRMIVLADLSKNYSCLEPSAGKGAIAKKIKPLVANLLCVEKNEKRAAFLELAGFDVKCMDFLAMPLDIPFMRILLNPPFENGQDMDHVKHAYHLLNPKGGIMVAVMSEHTFFAEDRFATEFRTWLKKVKAIDEKLPKNSFSSSGTGVNTRLVVIRRGKAKN